VSSRVVVHVCSGETLVSWQPPAGKIEAVKHHLELQFLGADIVTWTDPATTSQFFNIRAEAGPLFCLAVPRTVFDRLGEEDIVALMESTEIAEQMRTDSPRRVTLVADDRG
jgi:hypothetical protein